ncbi:hypothetical protein J2T03_000749 [Chryseobacterium lathyri]|nr:hypothetical protein [Chryseobacterium lathyri]
MNKKTDQNGNLMRVGFQKMQKDYMIISSIVAAFVGVVDKSISVKNEYQFNDVMILKYSKARKKI